MFLHVFMKLKLFEFFVFFAVFDVIMSGYEEDKETCYAADGKLKLALSRRSKLRSFSIRPGASTLL